MKKITVSNCKGFSLVELAVVVVIMAVITTIAMPWLLAMRTKSGIRADARDVHSTFRMAQTGAVKSYNDLCVHIDVAAGKYGVAVAGYFPATYKQLRPGNSFVLDTDTTSSDYFSSDPCFNSRGLPNESGALDITNDQNLLTMEVRLRPAGHVSSKVIAWK